MTCKDGSSSWSAGRSLASSGQSWSAQGLRRPSATVLAAALVAWIKHRRSSVKVTVTGPAKETVTVQADRIRLMDAAQVGEFTEQVARVARGEPPELGRAAPGDRHASNRLTRPAVSAGNVMASLAGLGSRAILFGTGRHDEGSTLPPVPAVRTPCMP